MVSGVGRNPERNKVADANATESAELDLAHCFVRASSAERELKLDERKRHCNDGCKGSKNALT